MPVTLVDTAGLRETDDPVERIGCRDGRARGTGEADLLLWLTEAGARADRLMLHAAAPRFGGSRAKVD